MRRVQILAVLALAAALGGPLAAQTAAPSGALARGIDHFQAGRYDAALAAFRGIAFSASEDAQKPSAYFWFAKTQLAIGRIDDAAASLVHYLATWPKAADRAEAVYLQGRILHQQEDFEAALRVFQAFLEGYPSSPFSANAWFWSAESLYGLGRLEEASVLYQKVVREYPTSAKVEAAEYKASLIKLKQREQELSRLLKWSHEEFLRTVEEYQRRQDSSDQTIAALQQRLAGTGTGAAAAPAAAPAAASTAAADKTIADLRAQLEAANKATAASEASAAAAAEAASAQASDFAARIADLERRLADANEAFGAAEASSASAEIASGEASDLEARIAELEGLLEAAREAAASAETAAAAAEAASADVPDLAARIAELEGQLEAAREAAASAEAAAAAAAAGVAETGRLLAAKAEALALKELLLEWLAGQEVQP